MNTRVKRIVLLVVIALGSVPAGSAAPRRSLAETIAGHLAPVRRIKSQPVAVAVRIVHAADGAVIYQTRASASLIPASNMKLITTAAAMSVLGPEFVFKTMVGTIGDDLVVIGSGDPSIGDRELANGAAATHVFDRIAAKLRKRQIGRLGGRFLVDSSRFDSQYRHPNWPQNQYHQWYAAPVAALNFNDNCVDLTAGANAEGQGQLDLSPSCRFIRVDGQFRLTSRPRTVIDAQWGENWTLAVKVTLGKRPAGPVSIPVDHPPSFFAEAMRETLAGRGVTTRRPIVFTRVLDPNDEPPENFTPLVECRSRDLATLIRRTNKSSQNLFAECLFKRLGLEFSRRSGNIPVGSWATGQDAIRAFLKSKLRRRLDRIVIDDGGGLSRGNRVSPELLVAVLRYSLAQPWGDAFVSSLAVAARDGTMKRRLARTAGAGRIHAKTGYLAGVSALSGYVTDSRGKAVVAFSMLFNGFPRGQLWRILRVQDRICIALVRYLDGTKG